MYKLVYILTYTLIYIYEICIHSYMYMYTRVCIYEIYTHTPLFRQHPAKHDEACQVTRTLRLHHPRAVCVCDCV